MRLRAAVWLGPPSHSGDSEGWPTAKPAPAAAYMQSGATQPLVGPWAAHCVGPSATECQGPVVGKKRVREVEVDCESVIFLFFVD